MKLLTKEIEKRFAEVGNQEDVADPVVVAKFFNPSPENEGDTVGEPILEYQGRRR